MPSLSAPTNCLAGSYCSGSGLSLVSGPCVAGYYCPASSSSATQFACTPGNFCAASSSAMTPCPSGYYCPSGSAPPTLCFAKFCNASHALGDCSANCASCTSASPVSCSACIAPRVLVRGGVGCVTACPAGYVNVTGVCTLCSSACGPCASPTASLATVAPRPSNGLAKVVGSVSGWVWGVDASNLLYACAPPCNGSRWSQVSPPPSLNGSFIDLVIDESSPQAPRLFVLFPSASMTTAVCQAAVSSTPLISIASLPVSGVGAWNSTVFTSRMLALSSQLNITESAKFALIGAQSTVGYFVADSATGFKLPCSPGCLVCNGTSVTACYECQAPALLILGLGCSLGTQSQQKHGLRNV